MCECVSSTDILPVPPLPPTHSLVSIGRSGFTRCLVVGYLDRSCMGTGREHRHKVEGRECTVRTGYHGRFHVR